MITLTLSRYYGSPNITKSHLTITKDGTTLLKCEARELGYRDYTEPFRGSSKVCMPAGTHALRMSTDIDTLVCLAVVRGGVHRGDKLLTFSNKQKRKGYILLGYADKEDPNKRHLIPSSELIEEYESLLLHNLDQEYQLIVTNDKLKQMPLK